MLQSSVDPHPCNLLGLTLTFYVAILGLECACAVVLRPIFQRSPGERRSGGASAYLCVDESSWWESLHNTGVDIEGGQSANL